MEKLKRIIKENKKIVIIVTVLLLSVIGFSSAYFMVGGKQNEFITFKAGTCLSITITEESESINLSNVIPVTIDEGLSYEPYTFTIKNNCDYTTPYQVSLESLNQVENTLGVDYVHVSLEDSLGRRTTEILGNLESTNITNENAYDARKILNGELEGNSTTYYKFRMWLDYDATKEQAAGKTYTSKIVISAKDNVSVDPEIIKIAYQEETSMKGIGEWYKSYTTRVNITDNKDTSINAKYCIDTSKCEPNTDIEITNNSYTYEYPNGSNYLCTQATDSKGNRSVVSCNELIKVDNNKPTIRYSLSDYETGSNNWYQSLKIKIEGTDNESGVAKIKYCITSSETCTPTEEVTETSTIVTLPANSENQKVCGIVIDNNGNESEISCSGIYKIDTDNPTVNVSIASSTAASNNWYKALSFKGEASDTTSGISSLKYCTTTSDSCTPDTTADSSTATIALSSNSSAQKVCYQATDASGRSSEIKCSDPYKVDTSTTTTTISIASQTAGSNSWYKALSLKVEGNNSYSGIASVKYCTTTSSTCTPSTSVTGTNTTITLSNNASAQKVCATATDNRGVTSAVACSAAYSVDTTNPTVKAEVASSTVGSNGWYKAISIKGTGSDTGSQVATIKHCTTTSSTCTPSTSVSGTTATVALSSNASAQKVCYQAIDTSGRTSSTACSNAYSMDNTAPSISISSTSATKNSITVNVSGSDAHSKVATYYYSNNNGSSYVSSTSNSYTFNSLSAGTTYTIKAYVVDNAGNSSSVASKSVTTEKPSASETILANMSTITTRSNFNVLTTSATGTIYTAEDDYGTSYYFAGNPTDNWVKFAGFYWRIIRINGDGTIRMIYQGTAANTTGTGTQTTTSAFNSSYNNNMYVGYMYTSGQVHGLGTSSTIKGVLDSWYDSNLASYAGNIDTNAGFCGDRQPSTNISSSNGSGGTGTTTTYYGGCIRFVTGGSWQSNPTPTYKCQNSSDLYTLSSSSKGNKALSKPIGLITVDEVSYAGGNSSAGNSSYYLYTGQNYWTMSPYRFYSSSRDAFAFFVPSDGSLHATSVLDGYGVRPVINLKADTAFADGGTGTSSNPYVVS